jgi:hypothetical protein
VDFRAGSVKKGRFAAACAALSLAYGVLKMPAQKGNRTKKKLASRSSPRKAILKRRRARARRK